MGALIVVLAVIGIVIAAVLVARALSARSAEEFMEFVRGRIEQDHPRIKIVSDLDFGWQCEIDGEPITAFLNNVYAMCRQQPESKDEIVERYLHSMEAMCDEAELSWEEARKRLLPAIKPQQYLGLLGGESGQRPSKVVAFDCEHGSDLHVLIAIDSEYNMRFASGEDIGQWQAPDGEVLKIAVENLAAKTTEEMWRQAIGDARQNGFAAFETGDCYDASRLLLPDFYTRVSQALGCERIAVLIPHRDALIAISADNAAALEKIRDFAARQHRKSGYPITTDVIYLPKD